MARSPSPLRRGDQSDCRSPDCPTAATNFEDGGLGGLVCNDGLDNDGDGRVDAADPGCVGATDADETDPRTQCNDAIDNDADGWTDLLDPICVSVLVLLEDDGFGRGAQCNDGVDNDVDGLVDADDPQCGNAADRLEAR